MVSALYPDSVGTGEHFFTRRLRWRLIGAWRWPLFVVLTVVDGLIIHWLPPNGAHAALIPGVIVSSFANLLLIGAIAPWIARRLAARQGRVTARDEFPPAHSDSVRVDRVAGVLLVLATLGLLVAGLGNQKVVVVAKGAEGRAAVAARAYVMAHAPREVRANFEGTADTIILTDGRLYRICGAYNDRRRAFCMFVDTTDKHHTVVTYDNDTEPNGERYPNSQSGGEGP
jgi:hypothetical protein